MAAVTYEDVVQLADQLSPQEQRALIDHLQATLRVLPFEEWKALFISSVDHTPVVADFSPCREDWYDDDGR
jgi:hypothetical protein